MVSVEVSVSTALTTQQDGSVSSVLHSTILTPTRCRQMWMFVLVSCVCMRACVHGMYVTKLKRRGLSD